MKTTVRSMLQSVKTALAVSSFLFMLSILIVDLNLGGSLATSDYAITKKVLGSVGIALGFGLPTFVYDRESLSLPMKTLIHMGVGCSMMLLIAYLLGWIPVGGGVLRVLIVVASMLLTAFVVWWLSYRSRKKLAEQINRELERKQK